MSIDAPETRKRILKAALSLLESGGANAVRMSDVARQAGISRQALYLHFGTRAEMLIAVTHYIDEIYKSDERLVPSRTAATGAERLDAYIQAWGEYIPEIYGTSKALTAMDDPDAQGAWATRMEDMREGCEAAIKAIARDGQLNPAYSQSEATDILWVMLSVPNWEKLTMTRGWSRKKYIKLLKASARRLFIEEKR